MRNLMHPDIDRYRRRDRAIVEMMGSTGDEGCGGFEVPFRSFTLRVVASSDLGWDHVSVSLLSRCPNWEEMSHIKRLFFRDDEAAMQLHVPTAEHINCHPYCLHLWRPQNVEIPRPPGEVMVAPARATRL